MERRIHRVYVTRNTEYHLRRDLCVAVRDRRSGRWLGHHLALRSRVQGGLRFTDTGRMEPNPGAVRVGEGLFFRTTSRDMLTSPVVSVERPPRETVLSYPR
ncbi:MAG: hypothetical protein ACFCGT_24880 [Sandaracinaceae bacterium]